jgi:acetyl esterase/lipase
MHFSAIGRMRTVVVLVTIPFIAVAAYASGHSSDARCNGRRAANIVQRELQHQDFPVTQEILQSPSSLYYNLVMREPHEVPADHRIFYGTQLLNFGDLRLPRGRGRHPVAVVIHGGGWASSANLHYMTSIAAELACMGVATWNIEYRRVGSGGEWPGLFQDVAAAADFVRELAQRYPLDRTRVITIGQSAGGHLALWLAARHRLPPTADLYTPDPMPILGAISLDGVPDLAAFQAAVPVPYVDRFQKLLGGIDGGPPELILERMQQTSPEMLLPLGVRQFLVHGDIDPSVPFELIPLYVAEARASGDTVELFVVKGGRHFESADPANSQSGPAVRAAVRSMLGLSDSEEDSDNN